MPFKLKKGSHIRWWPCWGSEIHSSIIATFTMSFFLHVRKQTIVNSVYTVTWKSYSNRSVRCPCSCMESRAYKISVRFVRKLSLSTNRLQVSRILTWPYRETVMSPIEKGSCRKRHFRNCRNGDGISKKVWDIIILSLDNNIFFQEVWFSEKLILSSVFVTK